MNYTASMPVLLPAPGCVCDLSGKLLKMLDLIPLSRSVSQREGALPQVVPGGAGGSAALTIQCLQGPCGGPRGGPFPDWKPPCLRLPLHHRHANPPPPSVL